MRNPLSRMNANVRQSFLYFLTVALGQGVAFFLLPLVTRYLTPAAYGQYSLALVTSSLVSIGSAAWIRNVGLRLYVDARQRETTLGFFVGTSTLQGLMFTVTYGVAILGLRLVSVEIAPLGVMLWAGAAQLVGNQYAYTVTLLRAEQRAAPFAVAEIGSGLIRFGATTAGLLLGFASAELLFIGNGLAFLIGTGYAVPALWRDLLGRSWFDARGTRELLRSGPTSLPFSVSGWLERLADRLVLAFYNGTAAVGIYSVGYAVGERLLGSLVQAVFMVAWPNILNAWRDGGPEAARAAIGQAQRMYIWITVGPALFLIVYGRLLVSWIAGPDYQQAAVVVPIIAASMWIGGFGSYVNRQFELNKTFGRLSAITLVGAAINVGLNFVLIPPYGMQGAAVATLVNQSFNTAVYYVVRDRSLVRIAARPLLLAAGLAGAAWGASLALSRFEVVGAAVFVVVYATGALVALIRIDHDGTSPGVST
jgi:O-antigen/teichoic acid export membrane protein